MRLTNLLPGGRRRRERDLERELRYHLERRADELRADGLTEAENPQGEMLGEEGVKQVIRKEAPSGSKHLEQKLLSTIQDFTAGRSLTDDITIILVERVGEEK